MHVQLQQSSVVGMVDCSVATACSTVQLAAAAQATTRSCTCCVQPFYQRWFVGGSMYAHDVRVIIRLRVLRSADTWLKRQAWLARKPRVPAAYKTNTKSANRTLAYCYASTVLR